MFKDIGVSTALPSDFSLRACTVNVTLYFSFGSSETVADKGCAGVFRCGPGELRPRRYRPVPNGHAD